jgi:hypothetical protein
MRWELGYVLAFWLAAGVAGAAEPSVVVSPMHADDNPARFPRLTAFPDGAVQQRVNEALRAGEAEERSDQQDCIRGRSYYYHDIVDVTYVSRRYLTVVNHIHNNCAAVTDEFDPETFDLKDGSNAILGSVFRPDFLSSKLPAIYRARYSQLLGRVESDCASRIHHDDISFESFDPIWLDSKRGGVVFAPAGPVSIDCHREMVLTPDELAPFVTNAAFLADLRKAIQK